MSGITPLIDTLMHQVLGRQGEVSLQRALSEQVKPVSHGEGPRPIQRDSSLDGRAEPGSLNDLRRMPASLGGERRFSSGEPQGSAPGSTQTHFSPAARSIADVLLRFPAPPAVIRPPSPLLTLQDSPAADVVAGRLEASVRDSGLFYESHLKRWFQGDMSRQQLLREPQMQAGPRPLMVPLTTQPLLPGVPFATNAESSARANALITPGSVLVYMPNDKVVMERAAIPSAAATRSSFLSATGASDSSPREIIAYEREIEHMKHRGHRDIVHESLQSLVRQQLDMLVMPAVRWEGDVWAGIFMALVIHLPARDKAQEDQQENSDPDDGWRSEMQLEVPNVGAFSVSLWFYRAVLSIDLTTADKATHHYLEKDIPALERRLGALDLEKVQVRARYMPLENSHDRAG